ncbi:MAG TPA: substrate-binding domain-containing protein [Rhizomicrobium sp.]|jgi:ABC-type phosphate transport system substrate-binding protein
MLKLHHALLATACLALAGVASFAPGANAATCAGQKNCNAGPYTFGSKDVFGGGSSLVAPYWRQTDDCFAKPAALIFKGAPPTFVDENFFDYMGSPPQDCSTTHINTTATVWYISTGSGTGIAGVFSHDPTKYGFVDGKQTQNFPRVSYGLSDAGLASSDVTIYNTGGTEQGVTVAQFNQESCSAGNNPYPNPLQCYGPLVQYPFSVDPVAQFYANQGTYEKWIDSSNHETDYHFNVQFQRGDGSGGLRLSPTTYCLIWNGKITNWNDSHLKADNGGVSLEDPADPTPAGSWSVPLVPVGRSDSSGTTSIVTRHWANVCNGVPGNQYTTGATTLQAAGSTIVNPTVYNVGNPNFPGFDIVGDISTAPGSNGVAQYAAFTASPVGQNTNCPIPPAGSTVCIVQGRLGYVGPDYVLPYVVNTGTNNFQLFSATLQNSSGNWEDPTPANALTAFGSIQPPQSNSKGVYCSSCLKWGHRANPQDWVQGLSPTSPLANPSASAAYPMVGTTNFLGYTCYAKAGQRSILVLDQKYINSAAINNDSTGGILAAAGLAPLPKQWRTAIGTTFVTNSDGLGLNIVTVGSPGACSVSGVIGG